MTTPPPQHCCLPDSGPSPWLPWSHLRVEASPDHHAAEVPEPVLSPHDEQGLVEVGVVLSQLLFLHLPVQGSAQFGGGGGCQARAGLPPPAWEPRGALPSRCTFSSLLAPFSPESSLSHCLPFGHFCISPCWSARKEIKRGTATWDRFLRVPPKDDRFFF